MIESHVTLEQIATHVDKSMLTIRTHQKAGHIRAKKFSGVRGYRVTLKAANEYVAKVYPTAGPMKSPFQDLD
ncbi:hypothetical protein [Verrucomicrobium sp. BvORR034]|uniref:hypothetical protein n=1 Tax=Verrucomicrobium sp. BvORR034 TaxID=1396418 RepID=UPI00067864A7|nr:hypothetical protein [Verrucomicrobium sp. BvORR034]